MKHLIHKRHHPHLRKRAILEYFGALVLIGISFSQRDIIGEAFATISKVNALWFIILIASYWLLLPLTAISYKLIAPKSKKIKISTTILAHLAGSGPGRIIPGGIGNISISSLHLKKTGLSIERSIGVVLTNNIIGMGTNISLVVAMLFIRPETLQILTDNISSRQLIVAIGILIAFMVLVQWLLHARGTRKEVIKTSREWRKIIKMFIRQPGKLFSVIIIGILITLIHTLMLDFSGYALGLDLSFADALIGLSFGVAIGGILPTPGGLGGVEAGTTATLIVLGYDPALATSIALLYRVATYWQPLIPGTLSYLYLRERKLI